MIAGTILLDLLWLSGFVALSWLGVETALATHAAVGGALGIAVGIIAALLAWMFAAATLGAILPKPRPGRHPLMKGRDFWAWVCQFVVRRWLDMPLVQIFWSQSALLRWLVMRLLGARFQLGASLSSDVILLDPGLFRMERGAMIGTGVAMSGHMLIGKSLVCGHIDIRTGVLVGAQARIAMGTVIDKGALIEPNATIMPNAFIGEGARICVGALVGTGARIGKGAIVERWALVPDGAVVPDGARFEAGPRTSQSAAGT